MSVDYGTIVADPPWTPAGSLRRQSFADRKGYPQRFYPVMSLDAIKELEIPVADHLWIWCLAAHIDWGIETARAWGHEPVTTLTWCKPVPGVGRFQTNTEHVLLCRRGAVPFQATAGTWFVWPRGRHSEKPDAFYDLVERVSPGPYLEMFSRRARFGWDSWGNEALGGTELAV